MTQEQLDQANAEGTDQADFSAVQEVLDKDPAAFLASLLGFATAATPDLETESMEFMDETVRLLLDFLKQEDGKHEAPATAVATREACERDAGVLMFKCKPGTLAISLAVLSRRYAILLEQWAELYAKAAIGEDDTVDLDAATTAEAKVAVTRATAPASEHKTGMYL